MTALGTLGWVLVHSVWQAALIAGTFALVRRFARAPASLRYARGYGAMLGMLPVTGLTALVLWRGAAGLTAGPGAASGGDVASTGQDAGSILGGLSPATAAIACAWLATVAVLLARWVGGWWLLGRVARHGTRPARPVWQSALASSAVRAGVAGPVTLLESSHIDAPTVIGHRRPTILVPVPAFETLGRAEAESLLAHELAHVRRRDFAANVAQTLIETLFFFHPAMRWLSRVVREERELCCDDDAVRAAGSRAVYARALAQLEAMRSAIAGNRLALAASGGSLLRRIQRLAERTDASERVTAASRFVVATAAATTLASLVGVGQVVFPPTAHAIVLDTRRTAAATLPDRYTIRAHDPAGDFTITFEHGRPTEATVGDLSIPRERLLTRGDSLLLPTRDGAGHFAVHLRPDGFAWTPRKRP